MGGKQDLQRPSLQLQERNLFRGWAFEQLEYEVTLGTGCRSVFG